MGFRLGWRSANRFALPLLQGGMGFLAFLYAWTLAGPFSAALAVGGWTIGTSFPALGTFRRDPAETDRRVLRAAGYRAEMLAWLASGVGPESRPRRTALVGDPKEFFVARRGQAFVTGLQAQNTLRLKWNEQSCTLKLELPEGSKDEIARVGPLTCSGVAR